MSTAMWVAGITLAVWLLILASFVFSVAAGKWLARREQQPFDPDRSWTP